MKTFLIPLSIAALTLVAIGAGAGTTDAPVRVADQTLDYPSNARENDVHIRQIADLSMHDDEYPAPSGDGGSPDIRFPGVPSA